MVHEIVLSPEACHDLTHLDARTRSKVRHAIEMHFRHEPTKTSRSRIKRLRGLSGPQYRLRVDDVRVFYDIAANRVEVLAIVKKSVAEAWLKRIGGPS